MADPYHESTRLRRSATSATVAEIVAAAPNDTAPPLSDTRTPVSDEILPSAFSSAARAGVFGFFRVALVSLPLVHLLRRRWLDPPPSTAGLKE